MEKLGSQVRKGFLDTVECALCIKGGWSQVPDAEAKQRSSLSVYESDKLKFDYWQ